MPTIKKAYRKRALKEHPDVNKAPEAKEKWQSLSNAYDILSDPEKLRKWEASRPSQGSGSWGSARQGSASSGRRERERWQEQQAWEARRRAGQRASGGASDFSGAASAVGAAAGVAAGIAGAAVDAAGKAAKVAVDSGVAGKAARVAGRAVEFAGAAGRSVLDGVVSPSASRIAKMKLDELLDFLGTPDTNAGGRAKQWEAAGATAAAGELRAAEVEVERLQGRIDSLRADQEMWERTGRDCQASGDKRRELDALRRALKAKDARKNANSELIRCYDRIDSLRKSAEQL